MNTRALGVVFSMVALCAGCKRPDPFAGNALDGSIVRRSDRTAFTASAYGDGSLPQSTASGPQVDATTAKLNALRAAVGFWRLEHRGQCPTIPDLAASPSTGFDPAALSRDAWGSPFEIDCLNNVVRLRSLGPDRRGETADDILRY